MKNSKPENADDLRVALEDVVSENAVLGGFYECKATQLILNLIDFQKYAVSRFSSLRNPLHSMSSFRQSIIGMEINTPFAKASNQLRPENSGKKN
jgi:hypothetical protein